VNPGEIGDKQRLLSPISFFQNKSCQFCKNYQELSPTMQQSLEEILRSCMAPPVSIKGKEGATVMPMEAIAMAIMNNAMKGDLAAANFIRQLTGGQRDAQKDEAMARERLLKVVAELRTALVADGLLPADGSPELELLAVEFSTLRRIAALLMADGHTDIVVTATKQELSSTNRTYNDLVKLFAQHMRDFRQQLIQAKIMRRQ